MGSTRSPAAPLDPSPYTHAAKHRSALKSSPEDNDHDHDHGASDRSRKKKKKSRKERHGPSHPHHSRQHEDEDDDQDMEESTTTPPPPVLKLPPIKISLRLPANPAIVPQPSSSSKSARNASSSNGPSKKKRRSSEAVTVMSEDDDGDRHQLEYPDEDHQEPQRRKKKHKHKHRHRHPKHEEADDNDTPDRPEQELQSDWQRDSSNYHPAYDHGVKETPDPTAARITVKLGTKEKSRSEKKSSSSSSSRRQHTETSPEIEPPSKSRSRSRSMSQNPQSASNHIKKEEPTTQQTYYNNTTDNAHAEIGQKRPFSALQSERSQSADTDLDEGHLDDPLTGELDEPEEDEDDAEEDEDEDDAAEISDDDDLQSPISVSAARASFGSKSVKGSHTGLKTVLSALTGSKNTEEASTSKDVTASEGSAAGPNKSARKGKHSKRVLTPKPTTPAIPKKKELSVVCHKLLDHFIRKDSYVLFSQPVDIVAVPDYPTVIKNPMDLSTMRAKVERNFYPNIDEFLKDFQLVCDNARLYNSKETLYWKQADKLWEWGSKAIDRERKTILEKDEEVLRAVKDEETLDIGGMGDYSNNNSSSSAQGFASRGQLISADGAIDSPMSFGDSGRAHTPQQYRKSKKIKQRRDGTIALSYATDGSIDPASHPDPWSLVPVGPDFGSTPQLCILNNSSTYYNGAYLDEYPYRKPPITTYRPANYLDYGPYATLKDPAVDASASGIQNIPAYTGMVFGDEKGEAYVRSLAMFLDGIVDQSQLAKMSEDDSAGLLEVQEFIRKKVETLTRGASTIVDKVATVVREESTGKSLGMDTRVPKALWSQEVFDVDEQEAKTVSEVKGETKELQTTQQSNDADMQDATESLGEKQAQESSSDDDMVVEVAVDINTKTQKPSEPEMIDIREIVDEIKAWPALLSKRKDFETWRLLKIELDNLLPVNQRSAPSSTDTPNSAADDVKVLWGERWTGEDSEEGKKWVREYLEKNSEDMRQVLRLFAKIKKNTVAASAPTATSSTPTPAGSSSTATTASSSSAADEDETQLLETLIKSIRVRLAEMAKY
ncbi:Bromodomain-containing protein 1, partial [Mortierella alpina]